MKRKLNPKETTRKAIIISLIIIVAAIIVLADLLTTYSVSGTVLDHNGQGIQGVVVAGGGLRSTTDENGNWKLSGLKGKLTLQANSYDNWEFVPSKVSVQKETSDVSFTGKYAVLGRVSDAYGNGIAGVRLNLSGESTSVTPQTRRYMADIQFDEGRGNLFSHARL